MLQLQASYLEECNEFLLQMRLDVRGVQQDQGPLKGLLQANQLGSAVFLRMAFDRRVHFAGTRIPGMVPCAVMSTGDSWYHGATSSGEDLCGFNNTRTDTDVHWIGEMNVMYVPHGLLHFALEQCRSQQGLQRLAQSDSVPLNRAGQADFKRLFNKGLAGELTSDQQILNFLTLCLMGSAPLSSLPPIDQDFHHFVMACRHNSKAGALSIGEICQSAHELYGAATLNKARLYRNKAFEAQYQLNPSAYFMRFRLEEARCALIRAEVPSVSEVRRIYRFKNKQQFQADFLAAFGETPLAVLERGQKAQS